MRTTEAIERVSAQGPLPAADIQKRLTEFLVHFIDGDIGARRMIGAVECVLDPSDILYAYGYDRVIHKVFTDAGEPFPDEILSMP